MLRRLAVAAPAAAWLSRSFYDDNSILGTSTMSGGFMQSLREDLQRENDARTQGVGETLTNYVRSPELTHMESPEADKEYNEKLERRLGDFFARLPMPEDPMKAALAKTEEELREDAAAEMLREAVREAYMRRLSAEAAEELRLRRSAERLRRDGPEEYFKDLEVDRTSSAAPFGDTAPAATKTAAAAPPRQAESADADPAATLAALEKEMEQMRAKMKDLEEQLKAKQEKK